LPERMIGLDDLPPAICDIELSAPPAEVWPETMVGHPRKISALVRLHAHPLAFVVLDADPQDDLAARSEKIWSTLRDAINCHLASDGLPLAHCLDDLATDFGAPPGCVSRRQAVLADQPRITVVVATREHPDSLRLCLEALFAVEYSNFEVVVVDNDPQTSQTADLIADRFAPLVRYVRENRRGLAAARNCGLAQAHGQIVAFVDDDEVVDRHWLTGIAEGFAAARRVGCVTGLILPAQHESLLDRHVGFENGFAQRIIDTDFHRPDDPLFPFTARRLGSGANMAFHAEVLRRFGGFDPSTGTGTLARGGDDLSAFFRVVATGHRLVYEPSAVVWRGHHGEMALRRKAFGYGVGQGAYLTSVLVHEPAMWREFLRRLPGGLPYAFSRSSTRYRDRHQGWTSPLVRLEQCGLVCGPAAYTVSRCAARVARPRSGVTKCAP
jgi:glycosyltransferase involved in cell wall biosynthesis